MTHAIACCTEVANGDFNDSILLPGGLRFEGYLAGQSEDPSCLGLGGIELSTFEEVWACKFAFLNPALVYRFRAGTGVLVLKLRVVVGHANITDFACLSLFSKQGQMDIYIDQGMNLHCVNAIAQ
jgi:hypothetical protein